MKVKVTLHSNDLQALLSDRIVVLGDIIQDEAATQTGVIVNAKDVHIGRRVPGSNIQCQQAVTCGEFVYLMNAICENRGTAGVFNA